MPHQVSKKKDEKLTIFFTILLTALVICKSLKKYLEDIYPGADLSISIMHHSASRINKPPNFFFYKSNIAN